MQAGGVFQAIPDILAARSAAASIIKLFDTVPEIEVDSTDMKTFAERNV